MKIKITVFKKNKGNNETFIKPGKANSNYQLYKLSIE